MIQLASSKLFVLERDVLSKIIMKLYCRLRHGSVGQHRLNDNLHNLRGTPLWIHSDMSPEHRTVYLIASDLEAFLSLTNILRVSDQLRFTTHFTLLFG